MAARRRVLAASEQRDRAVWPVNLVKVQVIGLQEAQRAFDGLCDVSRVESRMAAVRAQIRPVAWTRNLGGQHDPVAPTPRLEPAADDPFGRPLRFGARRDRITLGGVDQGDAEIDGAVQLGVALGLGVLFAPDHGAKRDGRHGDPGAAEGAMVERRSGSPFRMWPGQAAHARTFCRRHRQAGAATAGRQVRTPPQGRQTRDGTPPASARPPDGC